MNSYIIKDTDRVVSVNPDHVVCVHHHDGYDVMHLSGGVRLDVVSGDAAAALAKAKAATKNAPAKK